MTLSGTGDLCGLMLSYLVLRFGKVIDVFYVGNLKGEYFRNTLLRSFPGSWIVYFL